jgi:hypothetical protein
MFSEALHIVGWNNADNWGVEGANLLNTNELERIRHEVNPKKVVKRRVECRGDERETLAA